MKEILYESNYHYQNKLLTHCTVAPIQVIKRWGELEGFNTGANAKVFLITAIDQDGRQFRGSSENYFSTEKDAWDQLRIELAETIDSYSEHINQLTKEKNSWETVLNNLPKTISIKSDEQ